MSALPTGTVTFLFTDIEGSTKLLHEFGERYTDVLAEHRRLLREAFARHGGVEVDTQGDAFFYAFQRASDAAAAAREAQAALADGPVRVRMGIHTGEATLSDEGYVGMDVHEGARTCAVTHGGQVVLSERTRAALEQPDGLVDLGLHRLKDLGQPRKLYQLGEGEFPPLRSLNATNLPAQPAPLIGRQRELGEVVTLVRSGARLVTLTGPGGTGKTRLALQAAAELVDDFNDGVFWVPLHALPDADVLLPTVASTLGAKGALHRHVDEKRMLLLLDNLEQLLPPAAAPVAELLAACPNVTVLTTSRAPLRVAAEREYVLDPLALQDAVALFRERAATSEPEEAVREICRRLDGLPLAVELAAARTRLLPPSNLLERLGRALPLLTGGARDAPDRQRTLRATIEWSYDLLSNDEQRLFRGLGVFAGSFTLEAAEDVAEADVDTLESLVEKSLVRRWDSGRLGMLETIQEYAEERLAESDARRDVEERHASYFRRLAEAASATGRGVDEAATYERLAPDHANVRRAVERALSRGDSRFVFRVARGLWAFWSARGHGSEALGWVERALEADRAPSAERLDALYAASELARLSGALDVAATLKHELTPFARAGAVGEPWSLGIVLADLADVEIMRGNLQRARGYAEEAAGVSLADGRPNRRARFSLAEICLREGDLATAERLLEEVVDAAKGRHEWNYASALESLGEVVRRRGRLGDAAALFAEAIRNFAALGSEAGVAESLRGLALVEQAEGRVTRAATLWGAGEALRERSGEPSYRPTRDIGDVARDAYSDGAGMSLDEAVEYALSNA